MAPTYIKGGVWTNVEDEILRAAISKYGLNQWARVSSLLARKTAKQAKARWVEWLDPSIKKIEWSREEDEKLLHLAKIMPTQWRSIAPIVGRTATQCIERYQKLLDDAEKGLTSTTTATSTDLNLTGIEAAGPAIGGGGEGVRRFRPGDIDPTPESKPARPDEVDMDEDEKEMLSEARARLANTQGKKAKRKDRERLLEESRRLALLQKRRQLKQAGINTKIGRPKNKSTAFSMDYNADIPFEHQPAPGFYDTLEEKVENLQSKAEFDKLIQQKGVHQKESLKGEDDNKRSDKKKRENDSGNDLATTAAAVRAEKLRKLSEADQISKRRKLMLPPPQVRDDELEQIIKHTRRGDQMKKAYADDDGDEEGRGDGSGSVAGGLTGEYSTKIIPENTQSLRTPQIAPGEDTLRKATQDLINLTNTQSSLLGHENTPLYGRDTTVARSGPSSTGALTQTPNLILTQTPRRDVFGVNAVGVEATPREVIRRGFMSLPKPKNDFEIVLPEESNDIDDIKNLEPDVVEDAGERDRRIQAEKEHERQKEFKRRSTAIQRGLPRPSRLPPSSSFSSVLFGENSDLYKEISKELYNLLVSDSIQFPVGSNRPNGSVIEPLDDTLKASIESVIDEEYRKAEKEDNNISSDSDSSLSAFDSSQVVQALTKIAENSAKQEQKLSLVLGGYMKRQSLLQNKMTEAQRALMAIQVENAAFMALDDMESIGLSSRVAALQEEVNFLTDSERAAQEHYRYLRDIHDELLAKIHTNGTNGNVA